MATFCTSQCQDGIKVLKLYEYLDDRAFNKDAYIIIRKPKHTKEHIKKFQGAVQFHK